jgi:hypothetical protein
MDIVKGPGSAVYGPQGEGSGGYVDFVMKQPYFDREHIRTMTLTMGYWASGHSYSNPEATIDVGGPISDKLAYRVSYLSRYGDGYYLNDHDQTQDVYAAVTYLPTSKVTVEAWGQFYRGPDQRDRGREPRDRGLHQERQLHRRSREPDDRGSHAYFGYDIITFPNPPPYTFGSATDGSYSTVNAATAHTIKLSPDLALIAPGPTRRGRSFAQGQVKETVSLTPDILDRQPDVLQHRPLEQVRGGGATASTCRRMSRSRTARSTTNCSTSPSSRTASSRAWTSSTRAMTAYQDYQTEPVAYYDLSQPLSQIAYPGYALEGNTWGGGLQVPGTTGYSAAPGDGWRT